MREVRRVIFGASGFFIVIWGSYHILQVTSGLRVPSADSNPSFILPTTIYVIKIVSVTVFTLPSLCYKYLYSFIAMQSSGAPIAESSYLTYSFLVGAIIWVGLGFMQIKDKLNQKRVEEMEAAKRLFTDVQKRMGEANLLRKKRQREESIRTMQREEQMRRQRDKERKQELYQQALSKYGAIFSAAKRKNDEHLLRQLEVYHQRFASDELHDILDNGPLDTFETALQKLVKELDDFGKNAMGR
jgi:hypothetical protein